MRILVCDDERFYIDAVLGAIGRWKAVHPNASLLVSSYNSSEDIYEEWCSAPPYDMAFLDIQFPNEMTGLSLAHRLRCLNEHMSIVFVTNYEEYAIQGYKVNALRFLPKPIEDKDIFECLDIAYRQWVNVHDMSMLVSSNSSIYRIPYKAILYMESHAHYVNYLEGGKESFRHKEYIYKDVL